MTKKEQERIKRKGYKEAMRYIACANSYLQKTTIDEDGFYRNKKYVRTAYDVAYNGVLEALSTYFELKNPDVFESKEPRNFGFYKKYLGKENGNVLSKLDTIYILLYTGGCYEGITDSEMVKISFQNVQRFIDLIKPGSPPTC